MTLFQDNISPYISFVEGSAPSSPAATNFRLFYDSADHLLKWKNSAGTVTTIATGGGGSGSITASGYTQTTARMLGRTTASTGAIEEITVGSGLSLSAGALTATGGSAGALTFLEAHTASSSATLDFTTCISSTYDDYVIELLGVLPATDAQALFMRMGTGGGPTYDSGSNYSFSFWQYDDGANSGFRSSASATTIELGNAHNNSTLGGCSGSLGLYNAVSGTAHPTVRGQFSRRTSGVLYSATGSGRYISTTAITAFQFFFASGNIASGTIRVYGISKT